MIVKMEEIKKLEELKYRGRKKRSCSTLANDGTMNEQRGVKLHVKSEYLVLEQDEKSIQHNFLPKEFRTTI